MIRVLLQYDDTYFVQAFSNYASANCPNIEFICSTTVDKALSYLNTANLRIDAVLATQPVLDRVTGAKVVHLLAAERTVFSETDQMQIGIFQSGPAIIADIKNALTLSGNSSLDIGGGKGVHVVAAYSVQGGSGKTVLCYALAAAAVRDGQQALYINLEPFPALGQLYSQSFSKTMDDLLFALKSSRELAPVLLDAMERNSDGVTVLPPFSFAGDLLSLTQENIKHLLTTLVETANLSYIFIDLPAGFPQINLWVMELCTTVLQIYTDDGVGREHLRKTVDDVYFKNLPIKGAQMTVLNKCRKKDPETDIVGKIPQSESLQQGKMVTAVLERNPAFLKSCRDLLGNIV